ncbi:hypothetical protein ACR6HW_13735 [Fusibacter sp. JL298sf-3]
MFSKKIIVMMLGILIISNTIIYANEDVGKRTPFNAYPTELFYNDKQLEDAFLYKRKSYLPLRALSEELGYVVNFEAFDPEKDLDEGDYYNPYEVHGTFTITNGTDTVVIKRTGRRGSILKNGIDVTKAFTIKLINWDHVKGNLDASIEHGFTSKSDDLTRYLEEDTVYIRLTDFAWIFDGYNIRYDKSTGRVYVSDVSI